MTKYKREEIKNIKKAVGFYLKGDILDAQTIDYLDKLKEQFKKTGPLV